MDAVAKKKFFHWPCRELNPGHRPRSPITVLTVARAVVNLPGRRTRAYSKVSGLAAWGRELQMVQLSAIRCSCIAIL
jgi:hypothetical protein